MYNIKYMRRRTNVFMLSEAGVRHHHLQSSTPITGVGESPSKQCVKAPSRQEDKGAEVLFFLEVRV